MALNNQVVNLCSTSMRNKNTPGVVNEKGWSTRPYYRLPKTKNRIFKYLDDIFYKQFLNRNINDNDIIWDYEPFSIAKYKNCKRKLLIYEMCDDTSEYFKDDKRKFLEVLKQEKMILKEADIVFTISDYLKERKEHLSNTMYVVRNGVDFEHFNKTNIS